MIHWRLNAWFRSTLAVMMTAVLAATWTSCTAPDTSPEIEAMTSLPAPRRVAAPPAPAMTTSQLLDALGEPIPGATLDLVADNQLVRVESDGEGTFQYIRRNGLIEVTMRHTDYGSCPFVLWYGASSVTVPLVRRDSEAAGRALKVKVLDDQGWPVRRARVQCSHIRTPGEGLIQASDGNDSVWTDDGGEALLYLPDKQPRGQRGRLVPPGSSYFVQVHAPPKLPLFPAAATLSNREPAIIRMQRPTRFHNVRLQLPEGKSLDDIAHEVSVTYSTTLTEVNRVTLDARSFLDGNWLAAGVYRVTVQLRSGLRMEYPPLVVSENSPEDLVLSPRPLITFTGRVVNGLNQEPMPGVLVLGLESVAGGNLARLSDQQWHDLQQLPLEAGRLDVQSPFVRPLLAQYLFKALTRTDDQGAFEIEQRDGEQFYSVLACHKDFLPVGYQVEAPGEPDRRVPDLPLIPAGKALVRPVFTQGTLAVSPHWVLSGDLPPPLRGMNQWGRGMKGRMQFWSTNWMALNEEQPLWVPAGVRVRLVFRTPYDDKWVPRFDEREVQLSQGQTVAWTDVTFDPAIAVKVRVVDAAGDGIEGVPVRRRTDPDKTWSIVHNTDQKGFATFHAPPGSEVVFRVDAIQSRGQSLAQSQPLTVSTDLPIVVITLNTEQIRALGR